MGRAHFAVFVLTAFALFSGACGPKASPDIRGGAPGAGTEQHELDMEKMHVQAYGVDGKEWELAAPVAFGETSKNKLHARDIKIILYQKGVKATDLTADEGLIRIDGQTSEATDVSTITVQRDSAGMGPGDFHLSGHVVAISTDGSKLLTDWLRYEKATGLITSTAPVRIIRHDSVTDGVGMEATGDLSQIKIFKQKVTIKSNPKGKK